MMGSGLTTFGQGPSSEVRKSLGFQCIDHHFVGVYARTKARDVPPHLQLTVTDPMGRMQGEKAERTATIPNSFYGAVFRVPEHPELSTGLAVEICDAMTGTYEITVKEQGSEPYVLDVTGAGNVIEGANSQLLHHIPKPGRVLHYKFLYRVEEKRVVVRWLDDENRERVLLEPNDW